ncbi:metallophosphoesterase [Mucilaginibacter aquatilis]|uniref:Metallophosphoesterase n=1 Tax=Mucilaginibacter aquatilis TaxID=1517760 RepID=A0A6I4I5L9_9SPHI|nr:metallophosphoesterase [Mucilaginibacter aquatilis]MVN90495.1 metallophosphoesterase [Mucilaginibacter aquatilis]
MKIQFASDLHLEFAENKTFIAKNPLEPAGDILILAGDIIPLRDIDHYKSFFDLLSDSYSHVYWVPGNHEYYGFDIANKRGSFHEKIQANISLLNNEVVLLNGTRFCFTTLWSNVSKENAFYIERGLSDFHQIRLEGKRLTIELYNQMHADAVSFLEAAFNCSLLSNQKSIVVSHHVPTFQHYPSKYRGSVLNEAFATDMDRLIESSGAEYWIYGHNHALTPEFKIGKTKLVTNQLGYVLQNEHRKFNQAKLLHFG